MKFYKSNFMKPKIQENVKFIHLVALNQYLFAKLKKKNEFIQIARLLESYQRFMKSYQQFMNYLKLNFMKHKIQGNVKFVHLSALGQYFLAKLEKKNYTNIKLSIKFPAYCIELPAFSAKLSAFHEKCPAIHEFFKTKFYKP